MSNYRKEISHLLKQVDLLKQARQKTPTAADLWRLSKIAPDPWQAAFLTDATPQKLVLAARQIGKSLVAAMRAVLTALTRPDSLVLLISPSHKQSKELLNDKVLRVWRGLGLPAVKETTTELWLANGSRIVSLPAKPDTIRGYSNVALLIFDEAAYVPDELYAACRPMVAVSQGEIIGVGTPFGKRGWFYEAWASGPDWLKVAVKAQECDRITPSFLEDEKRTLGDRWFRQEYECSFEDTLDSVFTAEQLEAACCDRKMLF